MTRKLLAATLLALVAIAAPLSAQTQKCYATAHDCEKQIREMLSGKKYLGVKVEGSKLGLVVVRVVPDSPADRYGLRVGDRVIAVNGHDCTKVSIQTFKELIGAADSSRKVNFVVDRSGLFRTLDVRVEVMSKEQIDQVVAAHLRDAHSGETPHN